MDLSDVTFYSIVLATLNIMFALYMLIESPLLLYGIFITFSIYIFIIFGFIQPIIIKLFLGFILLPFNLIILILSIIIGFPFYLIHNVNCQCQLIKTPFYSYLSFFYYEDTMDIIYSNIFSILHSILKFIGLLFFPFVIILAIIIQMIFSPFYFIMNSFIFYYGINCYCSCNSILKLLNYSNFFENHQLIISYYGSIIIKILFLPTTIIYIIIVAILRILFIPMYCLFNIDIYNNILLPSLNAYFMLYYNKSIINNNVLKEVI